jgi:hypothetical protein
MLPLLFGLAGEAVPVEPAVCDGTCVPPADMAKIVTVLKERKCFDDTKPEFRLDPVNIVVDRNGRVFFSGNDPQPYRLHMKWCNYEAEGTGKVKVLAAVQEPPSYGFRFRPKAFVGMLVLEPFRDGKRPKDGLDAGLMVDALYWKDLNLNVHAGFRSVGVGVGVDIFRSFGAYVGYALAWDGFHHNPEASLWFAFW